jgi:hypothetical protein
MISQNSNQNLPILPAIINPMPQHNVTLMVLADPQNKVFL